MFIDMGKRIIVFLVILCFLCFIEVQGQNRQKSYTLENDVIKITISPEGITSITSPEDPYEANVINEVWKRPVLKYKILDGDWLEMYRGARKVVLNPDSSFSIIDYEPGMPQKMVTQYSLKEKGLDIDITIESMMKWSFTIGDLFLSLPVKRPGGGEPQYIFEECYTTHRYISGNGSFLFYARPSGRPPFLMILPKEGTKLEYFEGSDYFIHSFLSGNKVDGGTWRQKHSKCVVGSAYSDNSKVEYGFKLRWTDSWKGMRKLLYDEGLFDIHVVPGMSVPNHLSARFALHTKNTIDSVTAEFPSETSITFLGEKLNDHFVYEVQFSKLGENMLTIHYNDDQTTYLEFFSTEPIETLIKKRASFIVNKQQHRDPSKWYNGLFSVYDMSNSVLRSPDDTDGFDYWWGYVLACDDPALSKAPFVAAKNVYFPVDSEIEAVEYYIKNFVWDKLQRTDTDDPYPYGIYGVPNWKVARDIDARAGVRSRQLDRMQVWRSYDYPHIFMMYYHMYQIAKMYPKKVNYLDAEGYLERAFMTARGFFLYPYEIWGEYYKAYEIGCYNELVIEDIIQALEENNRQEDADWLRGEYEKKVKYFIYDNKYPYSSEYSFDRTAFESTHAFAKYGALNTMKADTNLWYDKIREVWYSHPDVSKTDALDFMERQLYAGLTVRGWLETTYYQLGADGSMSYMAKMGGWSILDYGKYFAPDPYPWLRLGYASYLSSWALMNTGTEESNYGYWVPGKINDGAMGWAFMSAKKGRAWIRKEYDRGAWMYDGEADLGNGAAMRIAETIFTDDPIFGWIAYGGILKENKDGFSVIPEDGLKNRFSIITEKNRLSVELDRDGFVSEQEILIEKSLKNLRFKIENRTDDKHITRLTVFAPQSTVLNLTMDGKKIEIVKGEQGTYRIDLPISQPQHLIELRYRL
ncbi:MAG: DUF5695 domain-containing protein [bacterium]